MKPNDKKKQLKKKRMTNHNNSVELLGYYGGDEAIACSAWTSTSRDLTPEKKERIPKLINQLWKAEPVPHGSPLRKE